MESKKAQESSARIESIAAIRTALRNSVKGFVDQSAEIFDSFGSAPDGWRSLCKKKIAGHAQGNLMTLEYTASILAESDYGSTITHFAAALDKAIELSKGAKSIRDALQIMDAGFNEALSVVEKENKGLVLRR